MDIPPTTRYIIPGDPIPLQRARHGQGRTYDSQKAAKLLWGCQLNIQVKNKHLLHCPLILYISFFMKIPKSKQKLISAGEPHFFRPDLSNLIKFVEDVCTGILYKDDSLIVECHATKCYDINPRTEFHLSPYKPPENLDAKNQ